MRREHFLPAVTVVLLALLLCGGVLFLLTMWIGGIGGARQSSSEAFCDFDVDSSGKRLIFSRGNELYAYELHVQRASRLVAIKGQIRELCVLSDRWALVSVLQHPKRADSDILLYRLDLQTGEMFRMTSEGGVWEGRVRKVSKTKFVFDQWEVKKGWDIHGLYRGTYIADAGNGTVSLLSLDTGSAYYNLEQILSDKKVLLSFPQVGGKKWLIGLLDKGIEEPNPKVVRRVPLKIVAHAAVGSPDGRYLYYTQENPAAQTTVVYKYTISNHTSQQITTLRARVIQLKMGDENLFILTDSANPIVWRINTRDGALHKVVEIHSKR
ncbi:MAG: hypothetical protein K6U12_04570 [Armatimonadetes bacterium]|mgnify:CR=1 FL=1|nr:hypothetical protein [Armatimonadota bacterium]CUU35475.1 hypothetical protein DCOP10_114243 [Armatimonadetes bacterium DC]